MDLLRVYPAELVIRGLEDWAWIGLEGLQPHSASLFGDQFLVGREGIWFLDLLDGTLVRAFDDRDAMVAALGTQEGLDHYLLGATVEGAERAGLNLAAEQSYAWKVPPVLGGPTTVGNVEMMDLVVWLSIMGQIHQKVKGLPPGTKIGGVKISDGSAGRSGDDPSSADLCAIRSAERLCGLCLLAEPIESETPEGHLVGGLASRPR